MTDTWIRPNLPNHLARRRRKLGQALFERSEGVVLEGPLAGFRLNPKSNWGGANFGPMVLGTYESSVLSMLIELSKDAELLIDIGAADGYFGVGLVARRYFEQSVCFEIDAGSRQFLREVAQLNNVEDRVHIFAAADSELISQISSASLDANSAVVLCDIEGGEFDLMSPEMLDALKAYPIVIELHENYYSDGAAKLDRLVSDASVHFDVTFLDRGARRLSEHPAVRTLPEDERWLLCSEGRGIDQRWLVLRPKGAGEA